MFTSGIPDQPTEVLSSYVEEAACGTNLRCHTILFNVDDYDINGPIPGRWANITKTAEALRLFAHATEGRFHWFREIGIIESDDIKLIQQEIDKAVEFSKKAYELVDCIKRKSRDDEIDLDEKEADISYFSEHDSRPKALPPPKPTALSLQRQQLKEKELEESRDRLIEANKQRTLPWRPNSSKVDAIPISSSSTSLQNAASKQSLVRSSSSKMKSSAGVAAGSTEPFYIGGNNNSKGLVFSKFSSNAKSIRKVIPIVAIAEKEENLTTKEWLKK